MDGHQAFAARTDFDGSISRSFREDDENPRSYRSVGSSGGGGGGYTDGSSRQRLRRSFCASPVSNGSASSRRRLSSSPIQPARSKVFQDREADHARTPGQGTGSPRTILNRRISSGVEVNPKARIVVPSRINKKEVDSSPDGSAMGRNNGHDTGSPDAGGDSNAGRNTSDLGNSQRGQIDDDKLEEADAANEGPEKNGPEVRKSSKVILETFEQDMLAKARGRRRFSDGRPGAVSVLEDDVTHAEEYSPVGAIAVTPGAERMIVQTKRTSLDGFEQDVLAKNASRRTVSQVRPGAIAVVGGDPAHEGPTQVMVRRSIRDSSDGDARIKSQARGLRDSSSSIRPGAFAVHGDGGGTGGSGHVDTDSKSSNAPLDSSGRQSLEAFEQSVVGKSSLRSEPATRPGVVAVRNYGGESPRMARMRQKVNRFSSRSNMSAGEAPERDTARKNSLERLEEDVRAKQRARPTTISSPRSPRSPRPGAVSVTATASLERLESDVLRKARGEASVDGTGISPGAQAVSGVASLTQLENDARAKSRAHSRRGSALSSRRDSTGTRSSRRGSDSGGSLGQSTYSSDADQDLASKRHAAGAPYDGPQVETASTVLPGAHAVAGPSALDDLENDSLQKSRTRSTRSNISSTPSSLARLESDALAKSRAMGSQSHATIALNRLEEDAMAKARARRPGSAESLVSLGEDAIGMSHRSTASSASGLTDSQYDARSARRDYGNRTDTDESTILSGPTSVDQDDLESNFVRIGARTPESIGDEMAELHAQSNTATTPSIDDDSPAPQDQTPNVNSANDNSNIPHDYQDSFASRGDGTSNIQGLEQAPNPNEMIFQADAVLTATSAVIVNDDEVEEGGENSRRCCYYGLIVGCLVVVAVILISTLISAGDGPVDMSTTSPTEMPSPSPTLAPTTTDFDELLTRLEIIYSNDYDDGKEYFEEVFADMTSPQYQAALWVANEDLFPRNSMYDARVLQRYSLAAFYFATGGDDWVGCNRFDPVCITEVSGWLAPATDECDWFAITCTDATITRIFFILRGSFTITLDGTLPREISLLTDLETLFLDDQDLSGTIPSSLAQLTTLKRLELCFNELEGTMPAEILSKNSLLDTVCLGGNRLTGTVPFDSFHWETIGEIHLSDNDFHGTLPSIIGQGQKLRTFDVAENDFEGTLPTELFNLTDLRVLRYGTNSNITGRIGPEFGQLSKLKELSLPHTHTSGTFPDELFQLTDLRRLDVSNAKLSGTLPELFVNFQELRNLTLDSNEFTGPIPTAFDTMPQLEFIELQFNQLTGAISESICERRYPLGSSKIQVLATDCGPMENGDPPLVSCSCCNYCNTGP